MSIQTPPNILHYSRKHFNKNFSSEWSDILFILPEEQRFQSRNFSATLKEKYYERSLYLSSVL